MYWLYWCLMHLRWTSVWLTHTHTYTHIISSLVKCRMFKRRTKQIFCPLPGMLYVLCEYWSSAGRIAWFNQPRHCLVKALYFVQCHVFCSQRWSSVIFQNRGSGLEKARAPGTSATINSKLTWTLISIYKNQLEMHLPYLKDSTLSLTTCAYFCNEHTHWDAAKGAKIAQKIRMKGLWLLGGRGSWYQGRISEEEKQIQWPL